MTALPCPPEHWPAFSHRLDALLALPADQRAAALAALPADEAVLRPWLAAVLAQQAGAQVVLAVVGVDDVAVGGLRHGVDGQVAALQILFQTDIGAEGADKAVITDAAFAFGAGEGVFFVADRVQKNRKILADGLITLRQQMFGAGADNDPVTVSDGAAEQVIPDGAAD